MYLADVNAQDFEDRVIPNTPANREMLQVSKKLVESDDRDIEETIQTEHACVLPYPALHEEAARFLKWNVHRHNTAIEQRLLVVKYDWKHWIEE